MEDQIVEVPRYRLEALAGCIKSCVSLWQNGKDLSPGQRPDEILLDAAEKVKQWIEKSCENELESGE